MMRRSHLVMVATAAGFAGLMSFHTTPTKLTLGSLPPSTTPRSTTSTTAVPTSGDGGSSNPVTTTTVHSTPAPTHSTATPAVPAASTTTALGASVYYTYGTLSVAVTGSRTHLTNVTIASINDGGNSLSESIDQYSIPILESEVLSVQNANIQGVSGASYTSAGFEQSLQSALSKLHGS